MQWLKRLGWPSGYTAPWGACALGALGGPSHRAATGPGELSGHPPPPRVSQGEQELCRPEAGSQTFGQVTFFFFTFLLPGRELSAHLHAFQVLFLPNSLLTFRSIHPDDTCLCNPWSACIRHRLEGESHPDVPAFSKVTL